MRIVFMGTPAFALPSLKALLAEGHEVAAVCCQPDRPAGRGLQPFVPPVARFCREAGLRLLQPERLGCQETSALFREFSPDAGVVVAYGKILRPWLLGLPRLGFLNVHASLLPKFRGAAPIARAIIAGETETGVSIMKLDEGMDTGPVYSVSRTPIGPDETAGELEARLAGVGAEALMRVIPGIEAGTAVPAAQEGEASIAPILTRDDGLVLWDSAARKIHDLARGLNPWPGASTRFRGKELRVWRTAVAEGASGRPGEILEAKKGTLRVAARTGAVDLLELQWPGKKRVSAADFINGTRVKTGEVME